MRAFIAKLVPALLAAASVPLLAACPPELGAVLAPFAEPVIAADPPTFPSASQVDFTATIEVNEQAYEITRVYVTWGRHGLPDTRFLAANRGDTQVISGGLSRSVWAASQTIAGDSTFVPSATLVGFRWGVDYKLRGGQDSATVETTPRTVRVGCPDGATAATLAADQAAVTAGFGGITNPHVNPLLTPTHGFVSFAGVGVAFLVNGAPSPPVLGSPTLLLFAPTVGSNPSGITEPVIPDPPYTLIGWAYAPAYAPGSEPVLGCLPREAWFIHEAGYHPPNGGFTPTPPGEPAPGAAPGAAPPWIVCAPSAPPPGGCPPFVGCLPTCSAPGIPHGRFWDIHLFATPSGTAAIGVVDGTGNAGINPAGGPAGAGFPPGSFFFPARAP